MKRFVSFEEFYQCISSYLNNELKIYFDSGLYFVLWSESHSAFQLSIKSMSCEFDPSFVYDIVQYLPDFLHSKLITSDNCIILCIDYEKV